MQIFSRNFTVVAAASVAACTGSVDLGGNDHHADMTADGGVDASTDGPTQEDASPGGDGGGGDADTTCAAARWPVMAAEAMMPPRVFAGLDLALSDNWEGLTLADAEHVNCKSVPLGPGATTWGFNKEVTAIYDVDTTEIYQLVLSPGYTGALSFHDRSGTNHYVMRIGSVPTKNGQPYEIPWDQATCTGTGCVPPRDRVLTELYNAMMVTFAPATGLTFTDSTNCRTDRSCLISSDGGDGNTYFGIRALSTYFNTQANTTQPTSSTLSGAYVNFDKRVAFSKLTPTLKIDAVGPTFAATSLGGPSACALRVGMTWDELIRDCVTVTGNTIGDVLASHKLIGRRTFDLERWTMDLMDVSPEVHQDPRAAPISQHDVPRSTDRVGGWRIRNFWGGYSDTNDLDTPTHPDAHGAGLVMREWARLVQKDIYAELGAGVTQHALAAAECVGTAPAAGCTGLEALALPGLTYPSDSPAVASFVQAGQSATVLGPSLATFCDDPGTFAQCPDKGALAPTARDRVIKVLGHGSAASLPSELRDAGYYYRWYAVALLRYLKAVGATGSPTPSDVAAAHISLESLSFDQRGATPNDAFRYVERDFVAQSGAPLVIEHSANLATGGVRGFRWSLQLESSETALYRSLALDKQAPAGATGDVSLTNLFGSGPLASAYASLHCATTIDAACTTSAPPPQDSPGQLTRDLDGVRAELARYPGVFGRSPFAKGASNVVVLSTDASTRSARIRIPNEPDPYHGAQPPSATLDAMVGWDDVTRAGGLWLATSATQDKRVKRAQLRFVGSAMSYVVHYSDGPSGTIVVDAIEADDFEGEVFLCRDPATGNWLRARAYASAATIGEWIAAHPGATAACGLVTRSVGGAVTLVASTTNGVQLLMGTADGAGRVVHALLYDPALVP